MLSKVFTVMMAITSAFSIAHGEQHSISDSQIRCEKMTSHLSVAENKILLMMDAATIEAFGKNYATLVQEQTGLKISQQDILELQKAFFTRRLGDAESILYKYNKKDFLHQAQKFEILSWTIVSTAAFLKRLSQEFYTKENYKKTQALLGRVKPQVIRGIQEYLQDESLLNEVRSEIQNAKLLWLTEKMITQNTVIDKTFGVPVVSDEFLDSDPMLSFLMTDISGLITGQAALTELERNQYAIYMSPPFFMDLNEGSSLVLAHELGHILSSEVISKSRYKNRVNAYGTCALRASYPDLNQDDFLRLVSEKSNELIADAVATWAIRQNGTDSNKASDALCSRVQTSSWEDSRSDSHPGTKIRIEKLFNGQCHF